MAMTDDAIHEFCNLQKAWLETELNAGSIEEINPNVVASSKKKPPGLKNQHSHHEDDPSLNKTSVLTKLESLQLSVGLYGRTVVQLGRSENLLLPVHRFTTGDEVEIRNSNIGNKSLETISGVVCEVTETSISVALFSSTKGAEEPEAFFEMPPFAMIPKSNVQVHNKMMSALSELQKLGTNHPVAGRVVEALFRKLEFDNTSSIEEEPIMKPFNQRLDASQLEAISFALSSKRPVALIHGPPGTGKTTTVAELIQQAVRNRKMKVLVVAASNVAVDTLLARLVAGDTKQLRLVRLGHPARLQPAILPYSLEALVQRADGTEIVQDVRNELQEYLKILSKPRGKDKRIAAREVKILRKEIRVREEKVVDELIKNANVVLATCVGAANTKLLGDDVVFDLVVIDEAAQALEAACWIAILRGKKLVMAGDHLQLPPTIQSTLVQKQLGVTLFERMMALYDEKSGKDGTVSRMLKVQYRMNENIANWASETMYGGSLATFEGIRHQTIGQLECLAKEVEEVDDEEFPSMLLIDTAGCDILEAENESGSRYNNGEADLVVEHVKKLLALGVPQEEVAVISPYNGQVELLRLRLLTEYPKLQIRSVDGFQGGEREAVVISLVRSHPYGSGSIGFLRDDRRLNVAITRAKRHCCVICDTDTVSKSSFIKSLIDWIGEHGQHQAAVGGDHDPMAGDLVVLEQNLERLIGRPMDNKRSSKKKLVPKSHMKDEEYIANQRVVLKREIDNFVASAKPGESMTMSQVLSKLDRKIVHEIAEELGIEHVSFGEDGADRRIYLKMPLASGIGGSDFSEKDGSPAAGEASEENEIDTDTNMVRNDPVLDYVPPQAAIATVSFQVLDDDCIDEQLSKVTTPPTVDATTLADLARERRQRAQMPQPIMGINPKPKIQTDSGKRLGGTKKNPPSKAEKDDSLYELDDMAFLDAQIDQAQNSHGIALKAKGKTYRTIVNGIILHKNKDPEPKKNAKASESLKNKLLEAQKQRAAKTKKR